MLSLISSALPLEAASKIDWVGRGVVGGGGGLLQPINESAIKDEETVTVRNLVNAFMQDPSVKGYVLGSLNVQDNCGNANGGPKGK
jgi:hypothetical protein